MSKSWQRGSKFLLRAKNFRASKLGRKLGNWEPQEITRFTKFTLQSTKDNTLKSTYDDDHAFQVLEPMLNN